MFFRSCASRFFIRAQAEIERRTRIRDQIAHDYVILHEAALQRNLAQHGFQHIFLAGKFFHFAVGELRSLEHGERDHFGAVANQEGALFFVAFQRELDAALYVEAD